MQILISLFVFAGTALPVYAVFRYPVPAAPPVNRRIARALGADRPTLFEQPVIGPVMSLLVQLAGRLNLPKVRANVRQDLDASGNAAGYTVEQYLAICLGSALVVGLVSGAIELSLGGGLL
ncbi:MAG: hypothetical protein AAFX76_09775, partial [Planctomycetota bacterium]